MKILMPVHFFLPDHKADRLAAVYRPAEGGGLERLADAGLKPSDIDGMACCREEPTEMAYYLGITPKWVDGTAVGGTSFLIHVRHAAAAMLDEFLARLAKRHPQLQGLDNLDSMLVRGLPTTRILEVAEKTRAIMIVLGSKGLTGIKHIVMGSVAERVVHAAKVPVTPERERHVYGYYTILVEDRNGLRARLADAGISTAIYYPKPLHLHEHFSSTCRFDTLEVAERVAARCISLPIFPEMTDDEVDYVASTTAALLS